jgi:hypothetical protein
LFPDWFVVFEHWRIVVEVQRFFYLFQRELRFKGLQPLVRQVVCLIVCLLLACQVACQLLACLTVCLVAC